MAQTARLWQEHLTGFAVEVSVTPASRGIRIAAPETPEGLAIAEVGLRYPSIRTPTWRNAPGGGGMRETPAGPV
jgi:hypothetical protein